MGDRPDSGAGRPTGADVAREKGAAGRSLPRVPERRCVACGRRAPQTELVRLRLDGATTGGGPHPRVVVDVGRRRTGRGAYLCPRRVCLDQAIRRRALQRAFRTAVMVDVQELAEGLEGWIDVATVTDGR